MKLNLKLSIICVILSTLFACQKDKQITLDKIAGRYKLANIANENLAISFDTVQVFNEQPTAKKEMARLGQRYEASDFTPTGFYIAPNETLTINIETLKEGSGFPAVYVGTYSRYDGEWNPEYIDNLKEGLNQINAGKFGGLIYIDYTAANSSTPKGEVKINFISGYVPTPHFVLGKTTNEQWQAMLDTWTQAPDVILESKEVMLIASRTKALEFRGQNQHQLMQTYDGILEAEHAIGGLDNSSPLHTKNANRILMTQTDYSGYFMYAIGYRTMFATSVMDRLLSIDGLRNNGWGVWHELGHTQQQEAWTWSAVRECTVNIYSLAAARKLGHKGFSIISSWEETEEYLSRPYEKRDFNVTTTDFSQLAMFHQLWLAFGDAFYKKLHQQTREENPYFGENEQKMRYFMLKACIISGQNLGDFFRKWGFKVNESIYKEIGNLNLPTPIQDFTTLRD